MYLFLDLVMSRSIEERSWRFKHVSFSFLRVGGKMVSIVKIIEFCGSRYLSPCFLTAVFLFMGCRF